MSTDDTIPLAEGATLLASYRDRIDHEDRQIGQRVLAFCALQAALLVGFVLLLPATGGDPWLRSLKVAMLAALPTLGLWSSVLARQGIAAALADIATLEAAYRRLPDRLKPAALPRNTPAQGEPSGKGHAFAASLPMTMAWAWLAAWIFAALNLIAYVRAQ